MADGALTAPLLAVTEDDMDEDAALAAALAAEPAIGVSFGCIKSVVRSDFSESLCRIRMPVVLVARSRWRWGLLSS